MNYVYKQIINDINNKVSSVQRSDGWFIPLAKDNSDYQQFRKDIANGAELQDASGTVMTASQIQAFIATLP